MKAAETAPSTRSRALNWLDGARRFDGGWAPCREVDNSTWVTSLVLLLGPDEIGHERYEGALRWVLRASGEETNWGYRLRLWLAGQKPPSPDEGWPWFPGAAAWVSPTATALLGLRNAARFSTDPAIPERIQAGQHFLLSHACRDGGWNHGGARALGYDAPSYPETTGLALLALRDMDKNRIGPAIARAKQLAATCRSPEGTSWLHMGLAAQGEANGVAFGDTKPRTVRDLCLMALADAQISGHLAL